MELILIVVLGISAVICFLSLMAVFEAGEPIGIIVAFICGVIFFGTLGAMGTYDDLKVKAASVDIVVEERDSLQEALNNMQFQYQTLQVSGEEMKTELVKTRAQLEGAKGNLERAKSDKAALEVANEFCATDLQMSLAEKSELEEDLRVSEAQLQTVRNLIRGN